MVEAFHDCTFRMCLTHYAHLSFLWNCLIVAYLYRWFMNTSKKLCSRHFYLFCLDKIFRESCTIFLACDLQFLLLIAGGLSVCLSVLIYSSCFSSSSVFCPSPDYHIFLTQSFTSFICLRNVILDLKPLRLLFRFWQKTFLFVCRGCSNFFNLSLVYFSFLFLCNIFSTVSAVRFSSTAFLV